MSYIDSCLSWNNVSTQNLIIFIMVVIISTLCVFSLLTNPSTKIVNEILGNMCLINCDHNLCQNMTYNLRDISYLMDSEMEHTKCLLTGWELSHLLLYVIIGYFFNIYIALTLSVLFELYEHYMYDCASILDLFWNTLGLFIGISIRYYLQ